MFDNLWLASLGREDFARLEPHLHEVPFEPGRVLYEAGEKVDEVWFPLRGVVSLMTVLPDGAAVETAIIGREGLVGVTCGPMNGRAVSRAATQTAGAAACMKAAPFSAALAASPAMRAALARYTEALFAQVQQAAACNALHRLEERMARWLLTMHDHAEGGCIELTQETLAEMLGVRRATVSEVGSAIEAKGLIRRGRGRIQVTDRRGLERASCGCYRALREAVDEVMEPSTAA